MSFPFVTRLRGLSFDRDKLVADIGSFAAAHTGCVMAPVLSVATSGAVSAQAGLVGAMAMSCFVTLGLDTLVQDVKPENCMRCAMSKLDGFRRQGKILARAAGIAVLTHIGMHSFLHAGHDHQSSSQLFTDERGRQYMVNTQDLCGEKDGVPYVKRVVDTVWIQTPQTQLLETRPKESAYVR